MKWLWFPLLMVILVYCTPSQAGHYCYTTTIQYKTTYFSAGTHLPSRYTATCAWGAICTKYRLVHRYSAERRKTAIPVPTLGCCTGWSGSSCNTHTFDPTVTFCPRNIEAQAEADSLLTLVTYPPPEFAEPHGFGLTVRSTHDNPAMLPQGKTRITYTARSTNNNKQATCTFTVFVKPPADVPYLQGYNNASTVHVEEGDRLDLQCRADKGNPPFMLSWTIDGRPLPNQNYKTEPTFLDNYENVMNEVHFVADRDQHGKTVTCTATKTGMNPEVVFLRLNVTFYLDPVVDYCPEDQLLQSETRVRNVSVEQPRFSDIFNDSLSVTCSAARSVVELSLGEHDVQCVAENQRTHRSSECSYSISLEPVSCDPPVAPANGALLCGDYFESHLRLCVPRCSENYTVSIDDVVPTLFACTLGGQWFPKVPAFNCSTDVSQLLKDGTGFNRVLKVTTHCTQEGNFTGASNRLNASQEETEEFSTEVFMSDYKMVCNGSGTCLPDQLTAICGPK